MLVPYRTGKAIRNVYIDTFLCHPSRETRAFRSESDRVRQALRNRDAAYNSQNTFLLMEW